MARVALTIGLEATSWPLPNAMLNVRGDAMQVSLHHGGGVGMGYSQHSGVVTVCDGTAEVDKRIARVLWCVKEQGLKLPML